MSVRLGLIQMNCSAERKVNLDRAEDFIREAARRGAQIVLLPEVFHEFFFIIYLDMKYFDRALRLDPNNLQAMLPYAELLYRRGQLQQARELVARFNKLLPEPTAESLWLALRIERKRGDRLAETSFAAQLRRRYSSSSEFQSLLRGDYD